MFEPFKSLAFLSLFYILCYAGGVEAQCRYMFATTTTTFGSISLSDADAMCKERAAASVVPEISSNSQLFVAWLSNDTHDALHRIGAQAVDCFQNANGDVVASSTYQLINSLQQGSTWDRSEDLVINTNKVWTHTTSSGVSSVMNCNDQDSGPAGSQTTLYKGLIGVRTTASFHWTMSSMPSCRTEYSLGCVQTPAPPPPSAVGHAYPLVVPCEGLAFVSASTFDGSSLADTDSMDEVCRAEARDSLYMYGDSWPQYRAVYSTSTRSASSMLTQTLCIGNLLGRPYWKRDSLAESFQFVEVPKFGADGTLFSGAFFRVWTGTSNDLSTVESTCSDWSDRLAQGTSIDGLGRSNQQQCAWAQQLLCVRAPNDFTGVTASSLVANARIMFVSRSQFKGDIGGLEQGDIRCRAAAAFSSLSYVSSRANKFIAFLSSRKMDALARLNDLGVSMTEKPYVNTLGARLFDSSYGIAVNATPASSHLRDENGDSFFNRLEFTDLVKTMTGTSRDGRHSGESCNGWISTDAMTTYGGTTKWLLESRGDCSSSRHLLCVEVRDTPNAQHYARTLKLPTPSPCLYMFRMSTPLSTSFGALENLDDVCVSMASTSSIPMLAANAQRFIGLASNSTLDFRTRLEGRLGSLRCWKNTQETLLVPATGDMFGGDREFHSGFWLDEKGYSSLGSHIMIGTRRDGSAHSATCNDWSGTGDGVISSGYELSTNLIMRPCNEMHFFACVQFDIDESATVAPTVSPTRAPTVSPTVAPTLAPDAVSVLSYSTKVPVVTTSSPKITLTGTLPSFTTPAPVTSSLAVLPSTTTAAADTSIAASSSLSSTSTDSDILTTTTKTESNVDDISSNSTDLLVPLIAGVAGFVFLLLCCVLLVIFARRRGRSVQSADEMLRTRRGGDSYYGGAHSRSDTRRSRTKATGAASKASRRSRSRRSQRFSAKLASTSAWNAVNPPFDSSLPKVSQTKSQYQHFSPPPSTTYTSVAIPGAQSEYVDMCEPFGTRSISDVTGSQLDLLKGGSGSGSSQPTPSLSFGTTSASTPYGNIPTIDVGHGSEDNIRMRTMELKRDGNK